MTGPSPTDRDKVGTKRHVLTDGQGIPLSIVIAVANTYDMKAAVSMLINIVVKRPSYSDNKERQNLYLDKKDMTIKGLRKLSRKYTCHILNIRH